MPQLVKAVDLAQAVRQAKNAAYAVPNQVREVVKAKAKATPKPAAPSLPDWSTAIRKGNEELIAVGKLDPKDLGPNRSLLQRLVGGLGIPDFVGGAASAGKWIIVGVVALAVIVVLPRLIPRN